MRQGRATPAQRRRAGHGAADRATAPRRPEQLSGGQRQRVALARALVDRPRVLLLDEPLGALDLKLREQMQIELKEIQREVGITFVFVTHDQDEALTLCDRIAVFNDGRIEQVGAAREVYEQPGHRVRRRLRRHVEPARRRGRPGAHRPGRDVQRSGPRTHRGLRTGDRCPCTGVRDRGRHGVARSSTPAPSTTRSTALTACSGVTRPPTVLDGQLVSCRQTCAAATPITLAWPEKPSTSCHI